MENQKNQFGIQIDKNAFIDKGEGYVNFPQGLVITDDTEQRNGTKYEIKSMDISEYKGNLTANHSMQIQEIIGKVKGIKKQTNKVTIDGIQFAVKENALALYAYNMIKGGYITDFSIETFGPYPEDDGMYKNSKLIGLSAVVVGNNKSARINEVVVNSIQEAKTAGLDISQIEHLCYNTSGDINNSSHPIMEEKKPIVEAPAPATPTVDSAQLEKIVQNAVAPLVDKVNALEKKAFDQSAKEPEFKKDASKKSISNELSGMGYKERHGKQINYAWEAFKSNSQEASQKLIDINKFHLAQLQEAGIVSNTITLADMGNFVISQELLSDIEGHRSDFAPLISKLDYRETLSLSMAWLSRSGDISMTEVETCDDGANGNLKPISEYTATINTSTLHELAAVTPVCNAATRFLAADLLADVAAGYRNDYDRKRAQLYVARLQQAVNTTGNVVTYSTVSDTTALKSFVSAWSEMTEEIPNGTFVFNYKTYGELIRRLVGAGISGPLSGIFTTGESGLLLGRPYIVVPNELLPELNTATTKSFTVGGVAVTVNKAVFYTDLSTFTGRTSGGLMYDLSTEAAYEENSVVKSAFQRNELVLRGSFFRGGAIKDTDKVVAMGAPGVS